MTLDHTLTWEVARVGGMLAYVLVTASVALGLLLSLKATSENWPRFITNELHRFVTLVALVFTGVHTLAVLVDPFTGFSLTEVFVPLAIPLSTAVDRDGDRVRPTCSWPCGRPNTCASASATPGGVGSTTWHSPCFCWGRCMASELAATLCNPGRSPSTRRAAAW